MQLALPSAVALLIQVLRTRPVIPAPRLGNQVVLLLLGSHTMNFKVKSLLAATILALGLAATASHATVVFDNISAFEAGAAGTSANATGSTPNTFMGDGYTLATGTSQITGFDLFPVNNTGTNFTALKINFYVWGTVNTGTVSAAAPAFGSLLGSYSITSTGTYTTGFFYSFESASPGVLPGITLTTPITVPGTVVGVTVNVQGSTDGVTFANVNSLSSVITAGAPATVGANMFSGYYRNANSEVNGNFTSTLRSLTGLTNQSIAMRIYGNVSAVPEPGTYLMMALGLGMLVLRRSRSTA